MPCTVWKLLPSSIKQSVLHIASKCVGLRALPACLLPGSYDGRAQRIDDCLSEKMKCKPPSVRLYIPQWRASQIHISPSTPEIWAHMRTCIAYHRAQLSYIGCAIQTHDIEVMVLLRHLEGTHDIKDMSNVRQSAQPRTLTMCTLCICQIDRHRPFKERTTNWRFPNIIFNWPASASTCHRETKPRYLTACQVCHPSLACAQNGCP